MINSMCQLWRGDIDPGSEQNKRSEWSTGRIPWLAVLQYPAVENRNVGGGHLREVLSTL